MSPDDPRHGHEAGHEQHIRDGEDPCPACHDGKLRASRRRTKRKTMGYRYTVPSAPAVERLAEWRKAGATYGDIAILTGVEEGRLWEIANDGSPNIYTRTHLAIMGTEGFPVTARTITRRVRALCRLGWTIPRIAEAAGVHPDTIQAIRRREGQFVERKVRDGVLAAYDKLSMKIPTASRQQEAAGITRSRNYAERMGWAPPLAWDDIDKDTRPSFGRRERGDIDEAVVIRSLAGEQLRTTKAEKDEIARRWRAMGRSAADMERKFGWRADRYGRTA